METSTYKATLIALRDVLHTELQTLGSPDHTVIGDWVSTPADPTTSEADDNVVADRHEDWLERRGELNELETRYNNVLRALEKINSDTFGMCELCQQPIEIDRLAVNPAARTCKTHINDEVDLTN